MGTIPPILLNEHGEVGFRLGIMEGTWSMFVYVSKCSGAEAVRRR